MHVVELHDVVLADDLLDHFSPFLLLVSAAEVEDSRLVGWQNDLNWVERLAIIWVVLGL